MIKFLDKWRKRFNNFNKKLKEIDTYDRVYCNGKLFSLIICLLCFLIIGCLIIAFVVLD